MQAEQERPRNALLLMLQIIPKRQNRGSKGLCFVLHEYFQLKFFDRNIPLFQNKSSMLSR